MPVSIVEIPVFIPGNWYRKKGKRIVNVHLDCRPAPASLQSPPPQLIVHYLPPFYPNVVVIPIGFELLTSSIQTLIGWVVKGPKSYTEQYWTILGC